MALRAVEHQFTGNTIKYNETYSSSKTVLGQLIYQYTGSDPTDKYAGPVRMGRDSTGQIYGIARPAETSTAIPGFYPHVVRWCNKEGFYSTGTVAVSETTVTGSGTDWLTDGVPIGAVIGFGTTNPDAVTTWYTISAIPSATTITLQDSAGTIAGGTSFVIKKWKKIDWVFLADNATAGTTRRISFYTYERTTSQFDWSGFITYTTPPNAGNITIRGMRVLYQTYTTGTVAVSGAAVTGSGTAWSASRIFLGSRIGFGSTDPTQISRWYYINAVGSDTSITIQVNDTAAGTGGTAANLSIAGGTAYVIEDLRFLCAHTNATATNGGLFMVAGMSYDSFATNGQIVAAAVTTDKVKACYWLADASTVTNTVAAGCAVEDFAAWTTQYAYVLDTAGRVYKYNFRAAMSLASGKTTSCYVFRTGVQAPAITGTMSSLNNGRIGSLVHQGGVLSLYFATTTRIYRIPLSNITSDSTNWASGAADAMMEVPTGGTNTYALTNVMAAVEIADQIDRLIITTTGAGGTTAHHRMYLTQYNTTSNQFDHVFSVDSGQCDHSSADNYSAPHLNTQGGPLSVWSTDGLVFIVRGHATAGTAWTNTMWAVPLAADWTYANIDGQPKQRLITPSIATPNCSKFKRAYVSHADFFGGGNLTIPSEPYKLYYRTAGISDDSGAWTYVNNIGDMSSVAAAENIQFMFEFRVIGTFCLPTRIYNIGIVYEDNTTDSHYQPSVGKSNLTSKIFAWRFSTAFGTTVPSLTIRLYDAVTGGLLLTDDTATPTGGTWEKSTDGGSNWTAYNTTDKANETTYIRYTPTTLGDDIKVRALLTQT